MPILLDTLIKIGLAVVLLAVVIAGMIALQVALRYTKPNIGYQVRCHRDRDYTFFVRNLDAVHYKQPMHVIVSGMGLISVGMRAGPWSRSKPVKLDMVERRVRVLVVLDEVPEEAAFAIHAHCTGDVPTIELAENSPLQSRLFRTPLRKFGLFVKLRYYGLRYVIGVAGFLVMFWGGVRLSHQAFEIADKVTVGVAVIVAVLSFALLVPVGGKRTIVGYLTSVENNHLWVEHDEVSEPMLAGSYSAGADDRGRTTRMPSDST